MKKSLYLVVSNYVPSLVEVDGDEFTEGTVECMVEFMPDNLWLKSSDEMTVEEQDEFLEDEQWCYCDGGGFTGFVQLDGVHHIDEKDREKAVDAYGDPIKLYYE